MPVEREEVISNLEVKRDCVEEMGFNNVLNKKQDFLKYRVGHISNLRLGRRAVTV